MESVEVQAHNFGIEAPWMVMSGFVKKANKEKNGCICISTKGLENRQKALFIEDMTLLSRNNRSSKRSKKSN